MDPSIGDFLSERELSIEYCLSDPEDYGVQDPQTHRRDDTVRAGPSESERCPPAQHQYGALALLNAAVGIISRCQAVEALDVCTI